MVLVAGKNISDLHIVQVELLKKFDEICKKYDLEYSLFAGTMIGAVRHEGFIPWDDDVDVCMMRKDYEKFLQVAPDEMGEEYFLQDYTTDLGYLNSYAKIRKNNTKMVEKLSRNLDIHNGIFLDVFPLDYIHSSRVKNVCLFAKLKILNSMIISLNPLVEEFHDSVIKKRIIKIVRRFSTLFGSKKLLDTKNLIIKKNSQKMTDTVCILVENVDYSSFTEKRFKSSSVEKASYMKFENQKFMVYDDFHQILTIQYGEYMELPNLENQKPTHNVIELEV